jgi:ligand-binding SRPBCC domain-containing protein
MHTLKAVQKIPATIEEVWELFSNPANLQVITPQSMKFVVLTKQESKSIFAGQIIDYRVTPLFGIPLFWRTEITTVKNGEFFIDEQRKGPYSVWHHEHHFKEIEGGVEMTDIVQYKNPFGFIGRLANGLIVRKKLRSIFEFRYRKVEEMFGKWKGAEMDINIY